jgi:hypothetical protein
MSAMQRMRSVELVNKTVSRISFFFTTGHPLPSLLA